MSEQKHVIRPGHSRRLGSTVEAKGVNFAICCPLAKVIELLLFKDINDTDPEVIELSTIEHYSTYYWHVFVEGVTDGQIYGWRVKELKYLKPGNIFDPQKILLDPYALRILFPKNYNRTFNQFVGSNIHFCAKSVVLDPNKYDWEADVNPKIPLSNSVIYEMHVAGFTKDESSGVDKTIRGTYRGIIEKIPYLKELGINAIELLPVFQFDVFDASPGKANYWGYSPMSFFAIHDKYASNQEDMYGPMNEFRDMVKALHKEGIEVILDVVYNHTSEGDKNGPIYSYKGLDNATYYIVDEFGNYKNYSGCGNSMNASQPIVKRMIQDSLHFWTEQMHVDGFRFDLACVLSRNTKGEPVNDPPTTWAISTDYTLSDVKLIAEPWDAAGMYQVGSMQGIKWREWNGIFRDDLRKFLRGDEGLISAFVNRILGSPDIYDRNFYEPNKSVNFVTCHDGFTLWDLVSYNTKHNLENGENNRDGNDSNFSSNYGAEGETSNEEINKIRIRQAKNFMLLNLFSLGIPMLTMGDEVLRTQKGNNNAYCQDSKISYMNWNFEKFQKEMFEFTSILCKYRFKFGDVGNKDMPTIDKVISNNNLQWHGATPYNPDWSDTSHSIGFTMYSQNHDRYYYIFINAYWEGLHVTLPTPPTNGHVWGRLIDTSLPSPLDVARDIEYINLIGHTYYLQSRSILVLCSVSAEEAGNIQLLQEAIKEGREIQNLKENIHIGIHKSKHSAKKDDNSPVLDLPSKKKKVRKSKS